MRAPPPRTEPDLSSNVELVRRFVHDIVNEGQMQTIAEVVHPDYRYHGPGGVEAEGHAGAEQVVAEFRAGISDLHVDVTAEIAEGDLVALTMLLTGTHDGELAGIPPTGASIELPMAIVTRVVDGLIVEETEFYDNSTLMAQLGIDVG